MTHIVNAIEFHGNCIRYLTNTQTNHCKRIYPFRMSRVYHAINTADVGSKLLLEGGGGGLAQPRGVWDHAPPEKTAFGREFSVFSEIQNFVMHVTTSIVLPVLKQLFLSMQHKHAE